MTTIIVWVLMTYNSSGVVYSPFVMTKEDCYKMASTKPVRYSDRQCVQVSIPVMTVPVQSVPVKKVR